MAQIIKTNAILPKQPAPELGENTREILEQLLGYKSSQVEALMDEGVVTE